MAERKLQPLMDQAYSGPLSPHGFALMVFADGDGVNLYTRKSGSPVHDIYLSPRQAEELAAVLAHAAETYREKAQHNDWFKDEDELDTKREAFVVR